MPGGVALSDGDRDVLASTLEESSEVGQAMAVVAGGSASPTAVRFHMPVPSTICAGQGQASSLSWSRKWHIDVLSASISFKQSSSLFQGEEKVEPKDALMVCFERMWRFAGSEKQTFALKLTMSGTW